jgi:hypothetical protein
VEAVGVRTQKAENPLPRAIPDAAHVGDVELVIGKNLLWVAQNHGHSAAVILKAYAKWLTGSTDKDVAKIRTAMGLASSGF